MDWAPLLPVLNDQSVSVSRRAGIFHESQACALVEEALTLASSLDFEAVGLTWRRLSEPLAGSASDGAPGRA
jgi:hypothetical protein